MDFQTLATVHHPTFCPGCGDFGIWSSLRRAIAQKGWDYSQYAVVFGVGCSGNMADFLKCHGFHSLHGRAVPNAEGLKLANHNLNVLCVVGDGDCYGEGGNHLLHAMRGNTDIKVIVHDNRVYGLTTGQTAPTSPKGFKSKSTPNGVIEQPVNELALAISQGATFVAQGFAGDIPQLTDLLIKLFDHKGFGILNVLQPCVTFNRINTYTHYRDHIYNVATDNHNPADQMAALSRVMHQDERIPIGVIYQTNKPTYQDQEEVLKAGSLVSQSLSTPPDMTSVFAQFTP